MFAWLASTYADLYETAMFHQRKRPGEGMHDKARRPSRQPHRRVSFRRDTESGLPPRTGSTVRGSRRNPTCDTQQ